jgi:uncharacterized RDD family membrane protein YckC
MYDAAVRDEIPALYSRLPRRIQAIVIDAAVLTGVLFIAVTLGAWMPSEVASRWVVRLGLLNLFCYEPLLTAYAGGTLGHRALNLRVVDDGTGGNLPLSRALLRWVGKSLLGWLSFVSMAATRRHQALHDLLSASTVQVRDAARAEPFHYALERTEPVGQQSGSGLFRRSLLGLGYSVVLFVLFAFVSVPVASDACLTFNTCSPSESAWLNFLTLAWMCATMTVLYLSLRGRMPGARAHSVRSLPGSPGGEPAAEPD